jgi:hypothetical protein
MQQRAVAHARVEALRGARSTRPIKIRCYLNAAARAVTPWVNARRAAAGLTTGISMFVVYWLEQGGADGAARFEKFGDDALSQALAFAEALRKQQAAGEDVAFVSLCSENPQSVGKAGAADAAPGYAWKKRRI